MISYFRSGLLRLRLRLQGRPRLRHARRRQARRGLRQQRLRLPLRGGRLLVYEFVDNGSLDTWIFPARGGGGGGGGSRCLPWALRCRAAVDVARALAYLHRDCRSRVLHLDVKPEWIVGSGASEKSDVFSYGIVGSDVKPDNVLFDEQGRLRLADFGSVEFFGALPGGLAGGQRPAQEDALQGCFHKALRGAGLEDALLRRMLCRDDVE
ncbi:putative receptor-like protein kinase [Iris pallida]|uniref:Receptor-like protein kinase n=1 Tax=Iris pallida TaxID=29817 RepID=A0AAX6DRY2_IRIPA|nr:putative receptor-like protein kinase [Iris pallida]